MMFETTTQRILLHLGDVHSPSSTPYPFEIHCFLPWNGSLLSVCNQFYCHTLKIQYEMLESHHKSVWKSSQHHLLSTPASIASHRAVDEVYQCYLPAIIDSFNILPVDASSYIQDDSHCIDKALDVKALYHHSSRPSRPQMAAYPKLKTHSKRTIKHRHRKGRRPKASTPRVTSSGDEYRRRAFEKHMRDKRRSETASSTTSSVKRSKKIEAEEEEEAEEPKLLLGFLRFGRKDVEDDTKRNKKTSEVKHREKKEDELQPLNRFLKNIKSISDRVAGITNEFHQNEVEEYESMRDHLYLQKIMSEADVDPNDQNVDEPVHWNKVETMFEVMDQKESSSRGKQHIERALKSLHSPDLRELLKQVRESLALLHNTIDGLSIDGGARRSVTFSDLPIPEEDIKALMDLDQFISPALKQQHLKSAQKAPGRTAMHSHSKSKASMLIEGKDDVLKSLDQTISLRKTAANTINAGKQILSSLKETASPIAHCKATVDAAEPPLIGIHHRPEVIYDSHPPENMTARPENRRESLLNAGILDEDDLSDGAVQPEKFVEDMLLSKIEHLTEECHEWKSKYNELTSQHRRMSVQHGEVVKALKNSDVLNGNERMSSLTDRHQNHRGHPPTVSTHDVAVQTANTMNVVVSDENGHGLDEQTRNRGPKSRVDAVAHVDRDLELEAEALSGEDVIHIPAEETDKHLLNTGMHIGGLTLCYQSRNRKFSVSGDLTSNIKSGTGAECSDSEDAAHSGLDQGKLDVFVGVLGALKSLRMNSMKKQTTDTGGRRHTMFVQN